MKEEVRKLGRAASIRAKQDRADQFAESMRWTLAEYSRQSLAGGRSPSLNDIARGLNEAGAATATGKGKWTARSVKNVQDRLAALDKVLAEARGVKVLADALLLEGLESTDWQAMTEERDEQMARYGRQHGDLRGFSYAPGPDEPPEVRRQNKRRVEAILARVEKIRRDKVEELRASGADPVKLARLELYMYHDALVDAGLDATLTPDGLPRHRPTDEELAKLYREGPYYKIDAMKREWEERDRKERHEKRLAEWAIKRARGGRTRKEEAARVAAEAAAKKEPGGDAPE
jgi:hypothetical protein